MLRNLQGGDFLDSSSFWYRSFATGARRHYEKAVYLYHPPYRRTMNCHCSYNVQYQCDTNPEFFFCFILPLVHGANGRFNGTGMCCLRKPVHLQERNHAGLCRLLMVFQCRSLKLCALLHPLKEQRSTKRSSRRWNLTIIGADICACSSILLICKFMHGTARQ